MLTGNPNSALLQMLCGLGPSLNLSGPSRPHLQEAEAAYGIPSNRGINSSIYLGKVTRAAGSRPFLPLVGLLPGSPCC